MIRRFLVRWVSNFVAVMLAGLLFAPHILLQERGSDAYWMTLAAFAVVLAVLQLYVRPIVYAVMGPITCMALLQPTCSPAVPVTTNSSGVSVMTP